MDGNFQLTASTNSEEGVITGTVTSGTTLIAGAIVRYSTVPILP
jgi:hypothetical protein